MQGLKDTESLFILVPLTDLNLTTMDEFPCKSHLIVILSKLRGTYGVQGKELIPGETRFGNMMGIYTPRMLTEETSF